MSRKQIPRVLCFASGKGGVGKTHTVSNLAISLAERGKSVLVLDADLGLANIDVLLGLSVQYTLRDVLAGRKTLEEILITGPLGIRILPATSGVTGLTELSREEHLGLMLAIEDLARGYDYLLIDTAAGIGRSVTFFSSAAHEVICVSNDEPTALTDAYALVKVLSREYGEKRFRVLMNDVSDDFRAKRAFDRLRNAAEKHLHVKTEYLGCIPSAEEVREAVLEQRAVVQEHPSSPVGRAFARLAEMIDSEQATVKNSGGMQFFFGSLSECEAYGS